MTNKELENLRLTYLGKALREDETPMDVHLQFIGEALLEIAMRLPEPPKGINWDRFFQDQPDNVTKLRE